MENVQLSDAEMVRLDDEPSSWKIIDETPPSGKPPTRPPKRPKWFAGRWAFLVYGFFLASLLFAMVDDNANQSDDEFGIADDSNQIVDTNDTVSSDPVLTEQPAQDLLFTIQDLPTGWTARADNTQDTDGNGASDGHMRDFFRATQFGGAEYVEATSWRFNSTADARTWFDEEKQSVEGNYSTETWQKGDDSIYWEITNDYRRFLMVQGNGGWSMTQTASGAMITLDMRELSDLLLDRY